MQQGMGAEADYQIDRSLFGKEQIGNLANLLRGIPLSGQTQTTATPPPSFASQLTQLGLGGLSLAKLLGGG